MENYLVDSKPILDNLAKRFENLTFKFLVLDIGVKVSVFFVHGISSNLAKDYTWRSISEEIALKFQSKIESKEDKWNLYIVYSFMDNVDKELKAIIENDKFSSRKIVEDNQTEEFSDEIANSLIVKHITNTDLIDLVNDTKENIEKNYKPKKDQIWNLIKDTSILGNKGLQSNIIEKLKKLHS
jgi:hypothetical protein